MTDIVAEVKGDKAQSPENDDEDDDGHLLATFFEALTGLGALHSFFHANNVNAENRPQCGEKELLLSKVQVLNQQKITDTFR